MSHVVAFFLVSLVAAIHAYVLVLEMFLWTGPIGQRAFGTSPEFAQATKVLAANQGLYNGFLAAGLTWGLVGPGVTAGRPILTFFLLCVLAAGAFGGVTVSRRIFLIQGMPAGLALASIWLS